MSHPSITLKMDLGEIRIHQPESRQTPYIKGTSMMRSQIKALGEVPVTSPDLSPNLNTFRFHLKGVHDSVLERDAS